MKALDRFWETYQEPLRTLLGQAGWFLISLLLALIVWIVATMESDPIIERDYTPRVDIRVVNLDPNILPVQDLPDTARITIRAPQSTWSRLTRDNIILQADFEHHGPGEYVIPLKASINLPGSVVNIEPSQLVVQLDVAAQKTVPVEIAVTGEPALGYEAGRAQAAPAEVTAFGPASLVEQVDSAYAEVPLNNARSILENTVTLRPRSQGNDVDNIELQPSVVQVTVPIAVREDFRTVSVLPNIQGRPPAGYTWQLESYEPDTIVVTGPQTRLTTMAVPVLTTPIDLTGQTASLVQEVGVILPTGIEPAAAGQTITVRISIEPIEGFRQFDALPVQLQGLASQYRAVVSPETVALLISGPRLTVTGLTEAEVRVVVDVAGLTPDTYQLNPQVVVEREGFEMDKVSMSLLPKVVEVQITNAAPPTPVPTPADTPAERTPTPTSTP